VGNSHLRLRAAQPVFVSVFVEAIITGKDFSMDPFYQRSQLVPSIRGISTSVIAGRAAVFAFQSHPSSPTSAVSAR
jgi:hypothetical protein